MNATPSTEALRTFLRSGTPPFAGRGAELERLLAFWRGAVSDPGCRVELLRAPEGGGKTRLLQELERRARAEDGLVLRLVLDADEPDVASRLGRLLAGREELRPLGLQPGDTPARCAAALARLSRLRPLLLLLDRAECLNREASVGLAAFLDRLDEEPLPVVIAGRAPLDTLSAQLEARTVGDRSLEALTPDDLARIWETLQGQPPPEGLAKLLHDESEGLPGALRRALGALLRPEPGSPFPPAPGDLVRVRELVARALDQHLETRLAHLPPHLRRALARTAFLGRSAARDSLAAAIGADGQRVVDELQARGALVVAPGSPQRLTGPEHAGVPLAAADDWARRRQARGERPRGAALAGALRGHLPLYDGEAWRHLERLPGRALSDPELRELSRCATEAAAQYERSPLPETGLDIVRGLDRRLEREWEGRRDSVEAGLARCRLLSTELYLDKRSVGEERFQRRARELIALCGDGGGEFGVFLLRGLLQLNRHFLRVRREDEANAAAGRIEALIAARPELGRSSSWLVYLGDQGLIAWGRQRASLAARVEGHLRKFLAQPGLPDALREEAEQRVGIHLLSFFDTPQEEAERWSALNRIVSRARPSDAALPAIRLQYLLESGRIGDFDGVWEDALKLWTRRRMQGNVYVAWAWRLAQRALAGEELESLEGPRRQMAALKGLHPDSTAHIAQCANLLEVALHFGGQDWVLERIESRCDPEQPVDGSLAWVRVQAELRAGRPAEVWGGRLKGLPVDDLPGLHELLGRLRALAKGPVGRKETEGLRRWLARPPARLGHLGQLRALSDALADHPEASGLLEDLAAAWRAALDWCRLRGLDALAEALVSDPPQALGGRHRKEWRQQARKTAQRRARSSPRGDESPEGPRIQLQALGELRFLSPGGEPLFKPSGRRQKTFVGLLVADCMLRQPLGRSDFGLLAVETEPGEAEATPARVRNLLGLAVHRLRARIGDDAVLTGAGAPRLNRQRVDVDLLRVHESLLRAEAELKEGRPLSARLALERVLDGSLGAVPLPGLYHEFFEALRDDFAGRRRRVVLDLAAALVREGDATGAQRLLRRMWQADPDDEDVVGQLSRLLVEDGRKGDALALRNTLERTRLG